MRRGKIGLVRLGRSRPGRVACNCVGESDRERPELEREGEMELDGERPRVLELRSSRDELSGAYVRFEPDERELLEGEYDRLDGLLPRDEGAEIEERGLDERELLGGVYERLEGLLPRLDGAEMEERGLDEREPEIDGDERETEGLPPRDGDENDRDPPPREEPGEIPTEPRLPPEDRLGDTLRTEPPPPRLPEMLPPPPRLPEETLLPPPPRLALPPRWACSSGAKSARLAANASIAVRFMKLCPSFRAAAISARPPPLGSALIQPALPEWIEHLEDLGPLQA